jgi:hypothetical protein
MKKILSNDFGKFHLMGLVPNMEMEMVSFSKYPNMVSICMLADWNSHVLIMKHNRRN